MSQFVIEVSDNKVSAFLQMIRSLNFIKKIEKISVSELDNRILRLGKSIKNRGVPEIEIISAVKSFRKKHAE